MRLLWPVRWVGSLCVCVLLDASCTLTFRCVWETGDRRGLLLSIWFGLECGMLLSGIHVRYGRTCASWWRCSVLVDLCCILLLWWGGCLGCLGVRSRICKHDDGLDGRKRMCYPLEGFVGLEVALLGANDCALSNTALLRSTIVGSLYAPFVVFWWQGSSTQGLNQLVGNGRVGGVHVWIIRWVLLMALNELLL